MTADVIPFAPPSPIATRAAALDTDAAWRDFERAHRDFILAPLMPGLALAAVATYNRWVLLATRSDTLSYTDIIDDDPGTV
ncbi:MAG: hypothetical protein C4523_02340 [Myxococcales bacterium]|nr:MAG: hypothetical protein C4523_02340 [Myxococcales bacterium]